MKPIKVVSGYFKSFDDTPIYFEVRGEGPPLVFAYGIGCLFNHWSYQVNHFSENYQTIQFDYRSHQKTDIPKDHKNINIKSLAQDLILLLEHLNIKKATFLGHSFGAQVLTECFHQCPDIFTHMIFVNGFVSNPLSGMFGTDISSKVFSFIQGAYDFLPESSSYIWKSLVSNPLTIPLSGFLGGFNLSLTNYKDMEIYYKGISSIDLKSFLLLFEDMVNYNGSGILKSVDIPCLIISGEKDSITPLKHQKEMNHLLSHSELSIMPYGSHCTQLDLPEYVNLKIQKFLES